MPDLQSTFLISGSRYFPSSLHFVCKLGSVTEQHMLGQVQQVYSAEVPVCLLDSSETRKSFLELSAGSPGSFQIPYSNGGKWQAGSDLTMSVGNILLQTGQEESPHMGCPYAPSL